MANYPETHLAVVPPTFAEVFTVPEGYITEHTPSLSVVTATVEQGPIVVGLAAAGEVGAIVRKNVLQNIRGELQTILETPAASSVLPKRVTFLQAVLNRYGIASEALRRADSMYREEYKHRGESGKQETDTDKLVDLYDRTEEFEVRNPVLGMLMHMRETGLDAVAEDRRSTAERLIRLVLSGDVDAKVNSKDHTNDKK